MKEHIQKTFIQTITDENGKIVEKTEYKKFVCKNCNKPITETGGGGPYTFFKCGCSEWVADDIVPLQGIPNWKTLRKRTTELY